MLTDDAAETGEDTGGPSGRRRYDSALMQERKARILSEAQAILAEYGAGGFTIKELSRRADVAQRTLYNSLGSKEDIIARAIAEHYDTLLATLPPFEGSTLAELAERAGQLAVFVVKLRPYAAAMVEVFFSASIDERIFVQLQSIPMRGYGDLIALGEDNKLFRKLTIAERGVLTSHFAHESYGSVTDFVAGRIDDQGFLRRAPIRFLLSVYPFLKMSARREADRLLHAYTERLPSPD